MQSQVSRIWISKLCVETLNPELTFSAILLMKSLAINLLTNQIILSCNIYWKKFSWISMKLPRLVSILLTKSLSNWTSTRAQMILWKSILSGSACPIEAWTVRISKILRSSVMIKFKEYQIIWLSMSIMTKLLTESSVICKSLMHQKEPILAH